MFCNNIFCPSQNSISKTKQPQEKLHTSYGSEQGWLTINDGARVDYRKVTEWFVKMVKEYEIRPLWVCYDAALSGYWVPEMEESGFEMECIRQGPMTWTYPMKRLGGMLEEKKIISNNNPMLRAHLCNTSKKSTKQGRHRINTTSQIRYNKKNRRHGKFVKRFCRLLQPRG